MKKLLNIIFTFTLIFFVSNSIYSQGWIMEESDNSVTFIGNGWVKTLASNMEEVPITSMYNLGTNTIILINEDELTYVKGSADDYCNAIKAMRDEMNKQMPTEQVKMMEDLIVQEKAKPAPTVIVQKGSGESIAGYSTTKYSILVDGELFEEKWISSDLALKGLVQAMNENVDLTLKIAGCSVPDEAFLKTAPEFSTAYKNVERSGIELKSISYEYGSAEPGTEVVSLQKEDLSSEEFEVPGDYSESNFEEFIMSMFGM